jgi:hypothetical protein
VHNVAIPDNPSNLIPLPFAEAICRGSHRIGDGFECNRKNFLPGAPRLHGYVAVWIKEHHTPALQSKGETRPGLIMSIAQPEADSSQLLEWNSVLVSEDGDCAQSNDVAEGVDATKCSALVVVEQRW